jgi:hypothetical protein
MSTRGCELIVGAVVCDSDDVVALSDIAFDGVELPLGAGSMNSFGSFLIVRLNRDHCG